MITQQQIQENIKASAEKRANRVSAIGIDNTALVASFRQRGGRILHVSNSRYASPCTFAYIVRGRTVELATSIVHPSDPFTKKIGTKMAIERFNGGKTVMLPVDRRYGVAETLREIAGF